MMRIGVSLYHPDQAAQALREYAALYPTLGRNVGYHAALMHGELRRARRDVCAAHHPHLDRAGVGAQQFALAVGVRLQEEGVVHLPRRVAGREIERREVVEVVLDVRAFRHREAHLGEHRDHLVHHLQRRMHRALAARRRG